MKLYIKAFSSYRSDSEELDLKSELKKKYKVDVRRKDDFIYLAILGAQRLKEKIEINPNDELYITSALGNVDILQRTNQLVTVEKQFIRPFDFINMLGNTTSYYVATSLGVKDKNIFQISDNFTFLNSLISIYVSLKNSQKEAVFGSVDLVSSPNEVIQKVLGLKQNTKLVSSANYQKISFDEKEAIASIEFDAKTYSLDEIKEIISITDTRIISSSRCKDIDINLKEYLFETIGSNVLNESIENKVDTLFIECYEEKYKILKIKNLV